LRGLLTAKAYSDSFDGDYGKGSAAAARNILLSKTVTNAASWDDRRVRIAVEQMMMSEAKLYAGAIDGLAGPATQVGLERWQDHLTFTRPPLPEAALGSSAVQAQWPRQADLEKFFGKPGENQTRLKSPYALYLDWDLNSKITSFQCHEKVHDAILRVMDRVLSHYGAAEIHRLGLDQFGGCLNVRKMRNGTAWSTHAWGIALDWDADRNPLRATAATAQFAKPIYARFVDLWEEEGFISLGRARNYDWMHFQAARL
jgi:D-alanyl-D-alanine carboxypeptidase